MKARTAKMKAMLVLAAAAGALVAASPASAALITSPGSLSYYAFPNVNLFTTGPETVAPGITWTSTNATNQGGSVYGWSNGYGFSSNGFSSGIPLAGLNDSSDVYGSIDTQTFTFSTPVNGVGGVLNWVPSNGNPVYIQALNSSNQVVDSLTLSPGSSAPGTNSVTPNQFYGFLDATADISSFTLTDGYVSVIGGLYAGNAPGPVPGAGVAGLAALALAGLCARTRRA
jgi:hypothetical protein